MKLAPWVVEIPEDWTPDYCALDGRLRCETIVGCGFRCPLSSARKAVEVTKRRERHFDVTWEQNEKTGLVYFGHAEVNGVPVTLYAVEHAKRVSEDNK